MAGGDRAINLALRVLGIGEVERDFQRVGQAGNKAFTDVKKSANGAAQEVSEYTARLRRAVVEAKRMADQNPLLSGKTRQSRADRADFIKGAVGAEQERMIKGLPDTIGQLRQGEAAAGGFAGGLGTLAARATMVTGAFYLLKQVVDPLLDAYIEHERALDSFNAQLSLTGNRSKVTAEEIRAMATAVVDSTLQTEEAALQGAQSLAKVSGLTQAAFEAALQSSARYADAVGKDLPAVLQSTTIPVLQALADRDLKALWKATEGLNEPLRVLIQDLAEAGRTADAQAALFNGLTNAAGDGPNGLTAASNKLNDSWTRLKGTLGENIAAPAIGFLNMLGGGLDWLNNKIEGTRINWHRLLLLGTVNPIAAVGSSVTFDGTGERKLTKGGRGGGRAPTGSIERSSTDQFDVNSRPVQQRSMAYYDSKYGAAAGGRSRAGGGRPRGGSGGESAVDKAKREAEAAEQAAQRIEDSNQKVVDSWTLRTSELEAKVGLEGEALKAVERQQRVDSAVRQLNYEWVEKQVEAERKLAAAKKQPFNEAAAFAAANNVFETKTIAIREQAEAYVDAEEATAAYNKRQAEAKSVLEGLKTPLDRVNEEIEQSIDLLRSGALTTDQFNARMAQLADNLGEAKRELDEGAKAWEGFGRDVAGSLADIALNGGSAFDILQQLIRLPLDRLIESQFINPVGDWIDGLTGNNRKKNAAAELAGLPSASQVLGARAEDIGPASAAAAGSVNHLAMETELASAALAKFAANLALSGTGGGASGVGSGIGSLLSLFGGGGGASAGAAGAGAGIAGALGGLGFARGTDRVPVGQWFETGENGKELMRMHAGGRLEVASGERSRRMLSEGGGVTIAQTINVPERADPRRTAAGIARSTQGALMRSARKGLAGTQGRG
jgi:hypothetical protein